MSGPNKNRTGIKEFAVFQVGEGNDSLEYVGSFKGNALGDFAQAFAYGSTVNGLGGVRLGGFGGNCDGQNAVAMGSGSNCLERDSFVIGTNSIVKHTRAVGLGGGANNLDAETGHWAASTTTTNATPRGLRSVFDAFFVMPADKIYFIKYEVLAVIRSTGESKAWQGRAIAKNIGGTSTLTGTPTKTVVHEDAALTAADFNINVDDPSDILDLTATGIAATNISWVGHITYNEHSL